MVVYGNTMPYMTWYYRRGWACFLLSGGVAVVWELLLASSQAMSPSLAEESVWDIFSLHGCEEQESRVEVGRKLRSFFRIFIP